MHNIKKEIIIIIILLTKISHACSVCVLISLSCWLLTLTHQTQSLKVICREGSSSLTKLFSSPAPSSASLLSCSPAITRVALMSWWVWSQQWSLQLGSPLLWPMEGGGGIREVQLLWECHWGCEPHSRCRYTGHLWCLNICLWSHWQSLGFDSHLMGAVISGCSWSMMGWDKDLKDFLFVLLFVHNTQHMVVQPHTEPVL